MAEGHGNASGTTAHTEVNGHEKGGFPPFESSTFASQIVSFAIAFGLLYLIVSKLALPRVGGLLDTRQSAIDSDLAAAQKLKDESDAALAAYEQELADAKARAHSIGADAREKVVQAAEAERKTLEASLAAKLEAAEKSIAATRQTAMGNVRAIASDAASAIVQRLTGVAADAKAVEDAVEATLKG